MFLFAQLTALWVFLEWSKTGEKRPLRIVDLGPGEGTLLLAMSKLATKWPQLKNSISFDVLEYSPYRKVLQQAILCHNFDDPEANMNYYLDNCRFASRTIHGHPITWHRSFHELPFYESVFSFFIAKDYFNSEGIYKFKVRTMFGFMFLLNVNVVGCSQRINGVWNQMMVDVYKDVSGLQKLRWKMKPSTAILKNVPNHEISYVPGDDYEVLGIAMMKLMNLVHFINRCEGAILIGGRGFQAEAEDLVDRDTFCGFKNFKRVDPLEEPGEADLSASIDFGYIERTIDWESMAFRSIGQANFLANLNFEARLQYYLKSIQNPIRRATMESDAKMLMETMGEEYRYMAICNRYCKEFPYGFGF